MALPKDPDRLAPRCEFPPSMGRDCPDEWLDYGTPPPECNPPVAEPMSEPTRGALSTNALAWACVGIVLLVLLLLWWIGVPTERELQ